MNILYDNALGARESHVYIIMKILRDSENKKTEDS